MKTFTSIFSFFFFLFSFSLSQAQINEHFTDGNFTASPVWSGDTAKFQINAAFQLHQNAPVVNDSAYISTPNTRIDTAEWQFFVKLDFSPSTSNQLRAYLVSDQVNLKSPLLNGYYLQMGGSGSTDSIEFYEQTGSTRTFVCGGKPGHCGKTTNSLRIKVRRDLVGNWTIWCDTLGGNNLVLEASALNNVHTTTSFFGFLDIYTSTRSDKFYFDDVYVGSNVVDVLPPTVASVTAAGVNTLDVLFSEDVDASTSQNIANFSVNNGIGSPVSAVRDGSNFSLVHLTFFNSFTSISYTLTTNGVKDLAGNTMLTANNNFSFYQPNGFDVLITELLADPAPQIGLPNYEFVEIYNRSNQTIDLKNWQLGDSTSSFTISTSSLLLKADSFLILCSTTAAPLFQTFGRVQALSMPSLNNTGDVIILKDGSGNTIHSVFYTDAWYQNNVKKNGGWSLEMIDTQNPCGGSSNWKASTDASGGTPGKKNSVSGSNADTQAPKLIRGYVVNNTTVRLVFDESLNANAISVLSNYQITPTIGTPASAILLGYQRNEVELGLATSIAVNTLYTATVSNLNDCSGNIIGTNNTAQFGIPLTADSGDIIINEILFNPKPNGFDFVELYNNSNKIIDLATLNIANRNSLAQVDNIYPITSTPYLIFPKTYIAITESAENVLTNYTSHHPENIVTVPSFPSFNDDESNVVITDAAGKVFDELHYTYKWQFALLADVEGVSLERISFSAATQDQNNWHSAASVVGFATPADENSQIHLSDETSDLITLEPNVFSPDNDGHNDFLTINYALDNAGYVATISIFDAQGRPIKQIANNETLPQKGFLTWDGTDDKSQKLPYDIYVIYAELFDLSGKIIHLKKDCVLGGKN